MLNNPINLIGKILILDNRFAILWTHSDTYQSLNRLEEITDVFVEPTYR